MNHHIVPIVFAANDYYVPYMSTAIQSIMENAGKDREYIFYILYREIEEPAIGLLKKQIASFPQFSIKFVDVTEYIKKYNFFVSRHITIEAYFRLLIPELLSEYKKVIYLDGDMICRTDVATLFDIDLKDHLFAAVRDVAISWYYNKKDIRKFKSLHKLFLELKDPDGYFNSGMLIFNVELFSKTISTNEVLELAASREWQLHDQDILNYLAKGKTLFLSYSWNFMTDDNARYLPEYLKNDYYESGKDPKIIHYIYFKPWNTEFHFLYSELFWKYAFRTPFIETIIERMKSEGLMANISPQNIVIANIKHRKGIGIRFILIDCVKAWLLRDKKNKTRSQ